MNPDEKLLIDNIIFKLDELRVEINEGGVGPVQAEERLEVEIKRLQELGS